MLYTPSQKLVLAWVLHLEEIQCLFAPSSNCERFSILNINEESNFMDTTLLFVVMNVA